ncbi:MAG: asparagine synthase [Methanoculleus sp. SDB]|nr:MAG: asparagine synthase [Methanoculleus sp. SDB]
MCGIAGHFAMSGGEPDEMLVRRMSGRLVHRGPDGEGFFRDGRIALAHRRLSIIDLSEHAVQPMTNEDGSLLLVFNGEIYNYRELRKELALLGHRFRSESDSEVILHAFEEWGPECLARFNGMWAFALYDSTCGELFCARDRFGIKPFYYALRDGSLYFASEIKALLEHPGIGTRPDDEMVMAFLAWGVMDHTPATMFAGISQLPPAHFMVVRGGEALPPERYWRLFMSDTVVSRGSAEEADAAGRCIDLLRDSVRLRLRSDVPVGTCLSGGIDSSTIVALINGLIRTESPGSVGDRQNTFSARYADERFDEGRFIDIALAGTEISPHSVYPDPDRLKEHLDRLVYMQDEPFGSLSIFAQYCVMHLAGTMVRVVLDGQGADEQLGGYIAYMVPFFRSLVRHPARAVSEVGLSLLRHHAFFRDAFVQRQVRSGRRALLSGSVPSINRYEGTLDRVLAAEIEATNLPALLHYEDRNSMAFSVEARVPFLDYRLAEFFGALPLDHKIRRGVTKSVLRKAIKGIVPDAIRCRMDKVGFAAPDEVWMKEDLRALICSILTSESFRKRKYWNATAVEESFRDFLAGTSAYSHEIWRIVCTELWLRSFFDGRSGNP